MTNRVAPCPLPESALLRKYQDGLDYADCYCVDVPATVTQAAFVEAFYTTPLFKCERLVLALFAARPSSDDQARQLAAGTTTRFAAWDVEAREDGQLLLADFTGRTRSWLMAVPREEGGTRLHFGSSVVRRKPAATAAPGPGGGFNALLGFHRLYSRLLLRAAVARLGSVARG